MVTPKPTKLLNYLETDRHFTIAEPYNGAYYITGDAIPIQIIESKKLPTDDNVFLKHLSSNLTQTDAVNVLQAYKKYGALEKVSMYLNRLLSANENVFREVFAVSATFQDFALAHFEKDGTLDRIARENQEKKARDTALEMLKDGFSPNQISRYVKMPLEWVEGLSV